MRLGTFAYSHGRYSGGSLAIALAFVLSAPHATLADDSNIEAGTNDSTSMAMTEPTAPAANPSQDADSTALDREAPFFERHNLAFQGYLWTEYRRNLLDNASPVLRLSSTNPAEREGYFEANLRGKWTPSNAFAVAGDFSGVGSTRPDASRLWWRTSYAQGTFDRFRLIAGKERITYSTGFAYSPLDRLNPSRDPNQPEIEVEGELLAMAEYSGDPFSITLLYSPPMAYRSNGLPDDIDFGTERILLRFYLNIAESDLNFVQYRIGDDFSGGLSAARYVFDTVELHGEAYAYSARASKHAQLRLPLPRATPEQIATGIELGMFDPHSLSAESGDKHITVVSLIGTRYMTPSNFTFVGEYYFNSDGLNKSEKESLGEFVDLFARVADKLPTGYFQKVGNPIALGDMRSREGVIGRHLILLTAMHPELFDYYTPRLVWQQSPEDGSFFVFGALDYRAADSVVVSVGGGLPGLTGSDADTEFGLAPVKGRAFARMVYYY